jgi:hypothetical protein
MDELCKLLRESLPEAIGGVIAAAVLALVGALSARVLWLYRRRRRMASPSPNQSSSLPPSLSPQQVQELLTRKRRRLFELRKQQALKGINTQPEILIEIEDLEEEIHHLEGTG